MPLIKCHADAQTQCLYHKDQNNVPYSEKEGGWLWCSPAAHIHMLEHQRAQLLRNTVYRKHKWHGMKWCCLTNQQYILGSSIYVAAFNCTCNFSEFTKRNKRKDLPPAFLQDVDWTVYCTWGSVDIPISDFESPVSWREKDTISRQTHSSLYFTFIHFSGICPLVALFSFSFRVPMPSWNHTWFPSPTSHNCRSQSRMSNQLPLSQSRSLDAESLSLFQCSSL